MSPLNHKRGHKLLAPPIFYAGKNWKLKEGRFLVSSHKYVVVKTKVSAQVSGILYYKRDCSQCLKSLVKGRPKEVLQGKYVENP